MENDIKKLISENEKILYEGKPDKECFIFESIFNPMLPFSLVLGASAFIIMRGALSAEEFSMIPFILVFLLPIILYLIGILSISIQYKNTYYIVTDSGIYVSSGIFSKIYNHKPFAELSHVDLHKGIFDQIFDVGDIISTSSQFTQDNRNASITISSVSNYIEVYNLVKKLQADIYADVMYPNDKRPSENHGYNTEYKG